MVLFSLDVLQTNNISIYSLTTSGPLCLWYAISKFQHSVYRFSTKFDLLLVTDNPSLYLCSSQLRSHWKYSSCCVQWLGLHQIQMEKTVFAWEQKYKSCFTKLPQIHPFSIIQFRPCLLTPTSGGNKSHESAIDTDSVAIRATKQLLTPTSVPAFCSVSMWQSMTCRADGNPVIHFKEWLLCQFPNNAIHSWKPTRNNSTRQRWKWWKGMGSHVLLAMSLKKLSSWEDQDVQ